MLRKLFVAALLAVGLSVTVPAVVDTPEPVSAANINTMRCSPGWHHQHMTNHWDACVYQYFVGGKYYLQWVESRTFAKVDPWWYCNGLVASGNWSSWTHTVWRC